MVCTHFTPIRQSKLGVSWSVAVWDHSGYHWWMTTNLLQLRIAEILFQESNEIYSHNWNHSSVLILTILFFQIGTVLRKIPGKYFYFHQENDTGLQWASRCKVACYYQISRGNPPLVQLLSSWPYLLLPSCLRRKWSTTREWTAGGRPPQSWPLTAAGGPLERYMRHHSTISSVTIPPFPVRCLALSDAKCV